MLKPILVAGVLAFFGGRHFSLPIIGSTLTSILLFAAELFCFVLYRVQIYPYYLSSLKNIPSPPVCSSLGVSCRAIYESFHRHSTNGTARARVSGLVMASLNSEQPRATFNIPGAKPLRIHIHISTVISDSGEKRNWSQRVLRQLVK
jgi:hypothetical protein